MLRNTLLPRTPEKLAMKTFLSTREEVFHPCILRARGHPRGSYPPTPNHQPRATWRPPGGVSHDQWVRCHGMACDEWTRTEEKVTRLIGSTNPFIGANAASGFLVRMILECRYLNYQTLHLRLIQNYYLNKLSTRKSFLRKPLKAYHPRHNPPPPQVRIHTIQIKIIMDNGTIGTMFPVTK